MSTAKDPVQTDGTNGKKRGRKQVPRHDFPAIEEHWFLTVRGPMPKGIHLLLSENGKYLRDKSLRQMFEYRNSPDSEANHTFEYVLPKDRTTAVIRQLHAMSREMDMIRLYFKSSTELAPDMAQEVSGDVQLELIFEQGGAKIPPALYRFLCDPAVQKRLISDFIQEDLGQNSTTNLLTIFGNRLTNMLKDIRENRVCFGIDENPLTWPDSPITGQSMVRSLQAPALQDPYTDPADIPALFSEADLHTVFLNLWTAYLDGFDNREKERLTGLILNGTGCENDGTPLTVQARRLPRLLYHKLVSDDFHYTYKQEIVSDIRFRASKSVKAWAACGSDGSRKKDEEIMKAVREAMDEHPVYSLLAADDSQGLKNSRLICDLLRASLQTDPGGGLVSDSPLPALRQERERELNRLCKLLPAVPRVSWVILLGELARTIDPSRHWVLDTDAARKKISAKAEQSAGIWRSLLTDVSGSVPRMLDVLLGENGGSLSPLLEGISGGDAEKAIRFRSITDRMQALAEEDSTELSFRADCGLNAVYDVFRNGLRSVLEEDPSSASGQPFDHLNIGLSYKCICYGQAFLAELKPGERARLTEEKLLPSLGDLSVGHRPIADAEAVILASALSCGELDLPNEELLRAACTVFEPYNFPIVREAARHLLDRNEALLNAVSDSLVRSLTLNEVTGFLNEDPYFLSYAGLGSVSGHILASPLPKDFREEFQVFSDADQKRASSFDDPKDSKPHAALTRMLTVSDKFLASSAKSPVCAAALSIMGYEISNLGSGFRQELDQFPRHARTILEGLIESDYYMKAHNAVFAGQDHVRAGESEAVAVSGDMIGRPILLCGAYRAVSAIDWRPYLGKNPILLTPEKSVRWLAWLEREVRHASRYAPLMYRLLAYTSCFREAGVIMQRLKAASIPTLAYDSIRAFAGDADATKAFLAEPRALV